MIVDPEKIVPDLPDGEGESRPKPYFQIVHQVFEDSSANIQAQDDLAGEEEEDAGGVDSDSSSDESVILVDAVASVDCPHCSRRLVPGPALLTHLATNHYQAALEPEQRPGNVKRLQVGLARQCGVELGSAWEELVRYIQQNPVRVEIERTKCSDIRDESDESEEEFCITILSDSDDSDIEVETIALFSVIHLTY